ncbi:BTAD domain-containing putative transcriptional regulator [Saccharothrix longispora]|uniref:DNA-binding SARP family transcriptional activator n=1 Tax=Saccharothrix longispora TaxID=33920 RepID=A0ABU1PMT2_9PSEU|nr:BTAD domain-containing putative transcriptional regulator [Saccharothrix longispora]MDR6591930.1 DNA-binding SARP family transcriptional activator [Saccharothrix longispora]
MPMDDGVLRVRLLGPVRAWLGDAERGLGAARQRTVFALLAGRANRVVSREELVDGVWGDAAPAGAVGSLHTYVSGLRRALGPARHLLVSRPAGYSLRLAEDALDVVAFERGRVEGQRLLGTGEWARARAVLDDVLGLWRGGAYDGVTGPFAEAERRRLGELRVGALEARARAALELGEHAEVAAEAGALVREHPWRESLRELLMLSLHRAGRHAEALDAYREARRALVADQGIEPGPGLRELHRVILGGADAPATRPGPPPVPLLATPPEPRLVVVPPRVASASADAFVGRHAETALLRSLVTDVLDGRGAAVWLEGEPGIGKSALLARSLADAADRGCQVGWAAADELGMRFPLHVLMECLDVAPASPDAHPDGGWGPTDPVAAAVDRLLALVDRTCARSPLVLVVDDLQWADDASVVLWHRLAAVTHQLPLLLVAALRPDPGRPELARVRRGVEARRGHVAALGPLAADEAEQLVGHIVGARPGAVLRGLVGRAAGNPLYLREVAHALVRRDAVRVVAGVADVDAAAADEVPPSLLSAVGRSLDVLSAEARDVLRSAALLGVEFRVPELAAVTGRPVLDLAHPLDEAVAAAVVVEAGEHLAFRHPYLRMALHDSLSTPVRTALHRQAAEALASAGAPVERVAEHLVAEPVPVDAWVLAWLVAHHATLVERTPRAAADLLARAADTEPADVRQRATVLTALGRVRSRLARDPVGAALRALAADPDPADPDPADPDPADPADGNPADEPGPHPTAPTPRPGRPDRAQMSRNVLMSAPSRFSRSASCS